MPFYAAGVLSEMLQYGGVVQDMSYCIPMDINPGDTRRRCTLVDHSMSHLIGKSTFI